MTADFKDVALGQFDDSSPLLELFASARRRFDAAQAEEDEAEKNYREIEAAMFDWMLARGISSMKIAGLGTCVRQILGPYPSIDSDTPNAAELFEEWARDEGLHEQLFGYQPKLSALRPIVKELRQQGKPLPPGIRVTEHARVSVKGG